jgi:hypothetical protein
MSKAILVVSICLSLILLPSCSKDETGPEDTPLSPVDLLPVDNEISGWTRDGAPQTAEDSQGLWDMINGEGQVFLDNGFVECARQVYDGNVGGSAAEIRYLYVFDLGNAANAKAAYDDDRSGTGTAWTDNPAGTEARIDDTALFAYTIHFWEDKYFVKLTIDKKNDDALDVLKLFARNVSTKIGG